ncbi:MAG: serine/threonine protein kinase, partial [Acidobacteria bacterium]|nr:serine/threonine protein kinase [Acidobacteriota bacterium]
MSPSRWQEVAEIFERVLDCPPPERATLLAEACGTRNSLRTEVESLLAAHGSAGESFLDEDALARQAASVFPKGLPPDLSGQSIKHFVLRERLGVGGMGEVYLAEDTNLRRLVALKLLSSRVRLDEEHLRRFAREARAASLLNHPNITTVYEFGEDGGRPYIVTEYVAGQTLRARLLQKDPLPPMPLDEALAIADQMLAALATAHAVGIIHRDIKPENLMLRPDGVVKVLDFGIAKLTPRATGGAAAATQFRSTEQGMVLGTPGYMSPEQARAQEVTARSDLFSFGVVLYEMLVGNLPFHTETKADYIATLLTTKPVPLSEQRPDLSRAYNT